MSTAVPIVLIAFNETKSDRNRLLLSDILNKSRTHGFAKSGDFMGELLQPTHLIIVLAVAFLMFGGKKLPELGAGLGKGIRSFKDSMREMTSDHDKIETTSAKRPETAEKETVEK